VGAAYRGVATVFTDAEGGRSASLYRGVEEPDSFTLTFGWDSVDAHPVLTQKPEYGNFGETISLHLAGQPGVRHVEAVA